MYRLVWGLSILPLRLQFHVYIFFFPYMIEHLELERARRRPFDDECLERFLLPPCLLLALPSPSLPRLREASRADADADASLSASLGPPAPGQVGDDFTADASSIASLGGPDPSASLGTPAPAPGRDKSLELPRASSPVRENLKDPATRGISSALFTAASHKNLVGLMNVIKKL
jgi:hypothetical protein